MLFRSDDAVESGLGALFGGLGLLGAADTLGRGRRGMGNFAWPPMVTSTSVCNSVPRRKPLKVHNNTDEHYSPQHNRSRTPTRSSHSRQGTAPQMERGMRRPLSYRGRKPNLWIDVLNNGRGPGGGRGVLSACSEFKTSYRPQGRRAAIVQTPFDARKGSPARRDASGTTLATPARRATAAANGRRYHPSLPTCRARRPKGQEH